MKESEMNVWKRLAHIGRSLDTYAPLYFTAYVTERGLRLRGRIEAKHVPSNEVLQTDRLLSWEELENANFDIVDFAMNDMREMVRAELKRLTKK
jgi:hypothetical protein